MFKRNYLGNIDLVWLRVVTMSLGLFFIFFSDAILSYFVPGFIQEALGGAAIMGLVVAFSSIVGLLADLLLPQLLKGLTVRKMIFWAVMASLAFSLILIFTTWWKLVVFMLLAMAVWGIYYEFLGFASCQFVADKVSLRCRSGAWAMMGTFKNLAYFLGPLIATRIALVGGDVSLLLLAFGLTVVGLVVFLLLNRQKTVSAEVKVNWHEVNLLKEFGHWWVLLEHVWPVVIMSLLMGMIDATFWTTGAVFTEVLAKESWWGGLFLSLYTLPSLFMGIVIMKWGVYKGKKKLAEKFLLFSGVALLGMAVSGTTMWLLAMVLVSSILMAVAWPLVDAVYSDIVARMGRERKHMIGLSNSTISLAYIIGPVLAGLVADSVGERMTFAVMGGTMVGVCFFLLLVTPKKLKLPQHEIQGWDRETS
jgi:MFS family permease